MFHTQDAPPWMRLSSSAALLVLLSAGLSACKDATGSRSAPVPVLTSVSPDTATAGRTDVVFTVVGTGFRPESAVRWNDTPLATTYLSETQLRANVPEGQLQNAGPAAITVATPAPGGGTSVAGTFTVLFPAPTLTSVSPDTATVGRTDVVFTVVGTGFRSESAVRWNDTPLATTYVSETQLRANIPEGQLQNAGPAAVTVVTPAPGGGTSVAGTFTVLFPAPTIVSVSPDTIRLGQASTLLTISGTGFTQSTTVRWNGNLQSTTYQSPTRLDVSLNTAAVSQSGTTSLTVSNPQPGGGTSAAATLITIAPNVRRMAIAARDLVWDSLTERLYLSIPSTAGTLGNTIAAVDPMTGSVTKSVFVGSEPNRLARSGDGAYLYVGLNGANAVRRLDLATFAPALQWSLPAGEVAGDLAVAPGQPHTVAVSRHRLGWSPSLQGVTIYDAGIARAVSSSGHTGGARIEFLSSASVLYGYNNAHTGFEFFTIGIDSSGARHIWETPGLISGFYTDIVGAAGRIYGTDGSVVDAERRVKIGTFASAGPVAVDVATGRAFFLGESGISVYDLTTFILLGTIPLSGASFDHPAVANTRLVRWGTNGLAFLDKDELFIITSPLVAP